MIYIKKIVVKKIVKKLNGLRDNLKGSFLNKFYCSLKKCLSIQGELGSGNAPRHSRPLSPFYPPLIPQSNQFMITHIGFKKSKKYSFDKLEYMLYWSSIT